jgi:hypothetical protein
MKIVAPAYIENGALKLHDRKGFAQAIKDLDNAGAMLELEVYDNESEIHQMRAYYFAVIVPHIRRGLVRS